MKKEKMSKLIEALDSAGYEIIKIKEKKESPDFPRSPEIIRIMITPIESETNSNPKKKRSRTFLQAFEAATKV